MQPPVSPQKPFAESCEQNKQVILDVLKQEFADTQSVFEIGSGTGQHAAFFCKHLPHLHWQCSDVESALAGIQLWLTEAGLTNAAQPMQLDVLHDQWPSQQYDAVFSANAVHIMPWEAVEAMFKGIGKIINANGKCCLYGPFNYRGDYTSESNARFDIWLKQRNAESGIRDVEKLNALAADIGLSLINDHTMPANNRILVWQKIP